MKSKVFKITCFFLAILILISYAATKPTMNTLFTDPVCGLNVNKSESHVWKCSGKKYYFDSYACKEAFKLNPKNFIEKKLVSRSNIIDPVCGLKVDLSESYDLTYFGTEYHFNSNNCKKAFKINPNNFIMDNYTRKDSIK